MLCGNRAVGAWVWLIYILAWASALLVFNNWAMPEPLNVGRATRGLPRFFLCMVLTQHFKTVRQGVAGIKRKEP